MRPTLAALLARTVPTDSGCLLWQGATSRGYASVGFTEDGVRHSVRAHRLVLEEVIGRPLRPGECALHRCDVPVCIAPGHLFVGSVADNNRDMAAKGRGRQGRQAPPGERHPMAKLTNADAVAIRRLWSAGAAGRELAVTFSVSKSTISEVVNGKRYTLAGV